MAKEHSVSKKQKGEDTKNRADEKIGSGPKGGKLTVQPSGSDNSGELAKRGMSSEDSAKHWKGTGYKVPTDAHGKHHPGK